MRPLPFVPNLIGETRMIIDKELEFSDSQAITGDAVSTNVVDLTHTVDTAPGKDVKVRFQVDTAFNTLTSLDIALQTATDEAFTSPVELASRSVALASLVAGYSFEITVPSTALRYLRVNYDVVGTDPTAGAVSAFFTVYDGPEGDISVIPGVV